MTDLCARAVFVSPSIEPGQAHAAAKAFLAQCERMFAAGVDRIAATAAPEEDARSLQQNAFYWGYVLKTISAQATIGGIGADEEGWHLYFKRRVLGYRVVKTKLPGAKRPSIRRELRSTTDLKATRRGRGEPDAARYMPDYLEAVMAIAAGEFGVTFEQGRRWEDWRS